MKKSSKPSKWHGLTSVISSARPLPTLAATRELAQTIGAALRCGDVVTLAGDLGAGKTTFAQFLIQSLSAGEVEVTSPTFTLLQTYPIRLANGETCELYHYDLYRITHPSALIELGIEDALSQVVLMEWPERLGNQKLPIALALSFTLEEGGTIIFKDKSMLLMNPKAIINARGTSVTLKGGGQLLTAGGNQLQAFVNDAIYAIPPAMGNPLEVRVGRSITLPAGYLIPSTAAVGGQPPYMRLPVDPPPP
jgi:tRNA threonylcarbamoyladenosine biosynthesis protein TsaE